MSAIKKAAEMLRRAAMAMEVVGTEWRESDPTLRLDLASALAAAAEMGQKEPARLVTAVAYRWRYRGAVKWQYGELTEETVKLAKEHNHEVQALGILPGAQGEEK